MEVRRFFPPSFYKKSLFNDVKGGACVKNYYSALCGLQEVTYSILNIVCVQKRDDQLETVRVIP